VLTIKELADLLSLNCDPDELIQILNINDIKGEYVPEGIISADSEIGIMFREVTLKMSC